MALYRIRDESTWRWVLNPTAQDVADLEALQDTGAIVLFWL